MKLRPTLIVFMMLIPLIVGSMILPAGLKLLAQDKTSPETPPATQPPAMPPVEVKLTEAPAPVQQPPVDPAIDAPVPPVLPNEGAAPTFDAPETLKTVRPDVRLTHFRYRLADQKAQPLADTLRKIYPRVNFVVDKADNCILVTNGSPESHERLQAFFNHSELSADEKAKTGVPEAIREFLDGKAPEMLAINPPVVEPSTVTLMQVSPSSSASTRAKVPPVQYISMLEPGKPATARVTAEQERYLAADRLAQQLADNLQSKSDRSPQEMKALNDAVQNAFNLRQEMLRKEVRDFRQRLDRLTKTLEERDLAKEKIVEHRVEELLSPNLRWNFYNTGSPGNSDSTVGLPNRAVAPSVLKPERVPVNAPVAVTVSPYSANQQSTAPRERLETNVVSLKYAKAWGLIETLSKIQGDDTFQVRMTADVATNSLVVFATPADLKILMSLLESLDVPPVEGYEPPPAPPSGQGSGQTNLGRTTSGLSGVGIPSIKSDRVTVKPAPENSLQVSVFAMKHTDAGELANALQDFAVIQSLYVRISVDQATNSLLVSATPITMRIVAKFLKGLDAARPPMGEAKTDAVKPPGESIWQGKWLLAKPNGSHKESAEDFGIQSLTVEDGTVKIHSRQKGTDGFVKTEGKLTLGAVNGTGTFDIQTSPPLIGLYKFNDGLLVLAYFEPGSKNADKRPANFDSTPDSGLNVYVFDRVAEPKTEPVAPALTN